MLRKLLVLVVFISSCESAYAAPLEQMTTWGGDFPALYNSAQQCLQVAKGVSDDNLYILEVDPVTGGIPVTTASSSKSMVYIDRHDYSSVNVTTGAYVELIASTGSNAFKFHIFDSSGETLVLATGAAASEVDLMYIPPGGDTVTVYVASGTRLSVKAISANATSGEMVINATD